MSSLVLPFPRNKSREQIIASEVLRFKEKMEYYKDAQVTEYKESLGLCPCGHTSADHFRYRGQMWKGNGLRPKGVNKHRPKGCMFCTNCTRSPASLRQDDE